jgi:hypothetical protein
MRRGALVVAFVALVAGAPLVTASSTGADPQVSVTYEPPVHGTVTDPFNMPASPYAAGDRGLDYATADGSPVRASAAGVVVFAGQVGGTLHVVVLHADGIRTSYSFLASIAVARGMHVAAGDVLGTTRTSFHFGARAGDAYVDPSALLGAGHERVHLVPEPLSEEHERGWLMGSLHALASVGGAGLHATEAGVAWAAQQSVDAALAPVRVGQQALQLLGRADALASWADYARRLGDPTAWFVTIASASWHATSDGCTADAVATPAVPQRHVLIEVAGLGSYTAKDDPMDPEAKFRAGAVVDVDEAALGYAPGDVVEFSYRGGTTRDNAYTAANTQVDIRDSAKRLAALIQREAAEHPGVPIDIVAHSQGGLVTRAALAYDIDLTKPGHPPIASVVTLATPHHGANLATVGAELGKTFHGSVLESLAGELQLGGIDPRSVSVKQLAENSEFIRRLNERPLPPGVWFTSIAGRGDNVVPTPRARLAGAHNVIVDVPGWVKDHDHLPGSAPAQRELGLALNHLPPSCQGVLAAVGEAVIGKAVSDVEDGAGAVLVGAAS